MPIFAETLNRADMSLMNISLPDTLKSFVDEQVDDPPLREHDETMLGQDRHQSPFVSGVLFPAPRCRLGSARSCSTRTISTRPGPTAR